MFVELNFAAHHSAISLKMHLPVRICQDQIRRTIRAVLIGAVKEAAEIWLNSEHVEIVPGGRIATAERRIISGIQPGEGELECRQRFETTVAVTQVEIVRIRLESGIHPVLRSPEALCLRYTQRP